MILAFIEHESGTLAESSLQMVTIGREVAAKMSTELVAVLIGDEASSSIPQLQAHGVSKAIIIRHDGLESYAPLAWARSLHQLLEKKGAQMLMAAATDRGNEVLAHIAAQADLPMAANCAELRPGDSFEVVRLRWGSSLLEEAVLKGDPKLVTIALDVLETNPAAAQGELAVEDFTPSLQSSDFLVRALRTEAEETDGHSLKTASIVVGGGRGVGSAEGYAVLEELAKQLGGVVGGTRVATNNGWRPHSDQIGLTGTRISPDLYIACGISGAIQHLVGCKGAQCTLVINEDPEAPFFAKADYGVLGNLHEVVPAIVEELRKL